LKGLSSTTDGLTVGATEDPGLLLWLLFNPKLVLLLLFVEKALFSGSLFVFLFLKKFNFF
jgi:hypothetical protein